MTRSPGGTNLRGIIPGRTAVLQVRRGEAGEGHQTSEDGRRAFHDGQSLLGCRKAVTAEGNCLLGCLGEKVGQAHHSSYRPDQAHLYSRPSRCPGQHHSPKRSRRMVRRVTCATPVLRIPIDIGLFYPIPCGVRLGEPASSARYINRPSYGRG